MLSNSKKILSILSASNGWPQIRDQEEDDDDERFMNSNNKKSSMDAPPPTTTATAVETAIRAMEKPSQEQIQQQQQPLKCPRCESTNTKFCYYNNYSLSQPRHFCKACKRYWTRGGTLRSVPVGGGCRKNKRVRRPNSNTSSNSSAITNINEQNTFTSQCLNPNGGGAHFVNPMLFGFPANLHVPHHSSHDVISNDFQFSGFENHHQQNQYGGLGLGFSSNGILGGNGFSTPKQILQDLISNSNPSQLVSTTTSCTTTIATISTSSLLTSSLQQHKFNFKNPSLMSYQSDLGMKGVDSHGNEGAYDVKNDHVKLEDDGTHNRHQQTAVNYDIHGHHHQSPMEASDPSILWSNSSNNGTSIGGNWLDPNFSSISSS